MASGSGPLSKRWRASGAYLAGALLGGVLLTGAAGAIGAPLPGMLALDAAGLAAGLALVWHLAGAQRFPGSRNGWQASRERAMRTRSGRVYFGFVLGAGILTQMTTPLVYALVVFAMAARLPVALLAGTGFAIGRSRPVLTGLRRGERLTPLEVSLLFTAPRRFDRLLGCGVAAAMLAWALAGVI